MQDFQELFKEIEQQIVSLAESTVSNYKEEAIQDAKEMLANIKADLIRWTGLLADKQIKINEFEWLINSDKELVKMKALEKAGLAASRTSAFGFTVMNLIIDTAIRTVVGNAEEVKEVVTG
ncbi:MAG: hypothetical protein ABIN97_10810 [Ginsengibacter sp.]